MPRMLCRPLVVPGQVPVVAQLFQLLGFVSRQHQPNPAYRHPHAASLERQSQEQAHSCFPVVLADQN